MIALVTFLTGLLFGLGLAVSEMTNPAIVLGFLDIFGNWNPSLVFVMGGAVAIGMLGYVIRNRRTKPWLADKWYVPTRRDIDKNLIIGSAMFGIGWGLSGYCPGPGLTALTNNPAEAVYFVGALIVGAGLFHFQNHRKNS
ncbi:hypothetical protein MGA5115_03140 [Marinomonas gallaica]|uniref:YeeE/YedE family protein n=1 Tax=Marinomonas gallaica TaxID=1806667 RepID=A0A1C3JV60_9GAMM|nr:DUF6691 family protein [Marinomonas gallaica]SBT18979.1 hypothetical protein MGA5115_03140 [Marinomonas gallaica]SBT21934.1 hypothetical protein MGA5116_02544 [Marinomonas gallaica]